METSFTTYDSEDEARRDYNPPEGESLYDRLKTYRRLREQLVDVVEDQGYGSQASAAGNISRVIIEFKADDIEGEISFSMYPTYQVISGNPTVNGEEISISTESYDSAKWLNDFFDDVAAEDINMG